MSKLSPSANALAGVQWLFFMFANTVVIPLSVGAAFHQTPEAIQSALQLSFIYTGLACALQALLGHRLPLMEGQSGLWWGVILSLAASAPSAHLSLAAIGGGLATGTIASGIAITLFGALGMGKLLQKWFTPIVMAVFLLLLASQLCMLFFKGMIGLSSGSQINPSVALLSVVLALLVAILSLKGRGLVSNFAILIGIVVGWIAYTLLFPQKGTSMAASQASLFTLFPWGKPNLLLGIVISAFLTGLVNTTNTMASLRGAEPLFEQRTTDAQYRRSFALTGLNTVVAGLFGMVPYAPYTSSLGFLRSTRILQRVPFIIGALLFVLLGSIPVLGRFFSTVPISVGDAVLFVAYLQLFGSALQNIEGVRFNFKTIYRIAAPTLLGFCIMNIPAQAFSTLPANLRPLLSNGLLIGIFAAILLENLIRWQRYETEPAAVPAKTERGNSEL